MTDDDEAASLAASINDHLDATAPVWSRHTCGQCGQKFERRMWGFAPMLRGEPGRPPAYCSNRCRQAAYRGRVKAREARRQELLANGLPDLDIDVNF